MDQLLSEQVTVEVDNKAKIGLILGLICLLAWISTLVSFSLGGGIAVTFGLLVMFAIVAVIGIICSVVGFKAHKIKAILGIFFCLLGIYPLIVVVQLQRQIGEVGNTTYKEADFTIQIPVGWVKVSPPISTRSLRAYFVPKKDSDSYQPRMFISSAKNETTMDLTTFSGLQEKNIKEENNFISGRIMLGADGEQYVINYTSNIEGGRVRGIEILKIKNGVGYSVTFSTLESSWEKYRSELSRSSYSFTVL